MGRVSRKGMVRSHDWAGRELRLLESTTYSFHVRDEAAGGPDAGTMDIPHTIEAYEEMAMEHDILASATGKLLFCLVTHENGWMVTSDNSWHACWKISLFEPTPPPAEKSYRLSACVSGIGLERFSDVNSWGSCCLLFVFWNSIDSLVNLTLADTKYLLLSHLFHKHRQNVNQQQRWQRRR